MTQWKSLIFEAMFMNRFWSGKWHYRSFLQRLVVFMAIGFIMIAKSMYFCLFVTIVSRKLQRSISVGTWSPIILSRWWHIFPVKARRHTEVSINEVLKTSKNKNGEGPWGKKKKKDLMWSLDLGDSFAWVSKSQVGRLNQNP